MMLKLSGRKKKGKPQRKFMDVVKKDMLTTDLTEDASDEVRLRQMTPKGSNRKKKTGFKPLSQIRAPLYEFLYGFPMSHLIWSEIPVIDQRLY